MGTKIGLGGFPGYTTSVLTEQNQIQFSATNGIGRLYSMSKPELRRALEELSEFDHVVFRLSGENPMEFIDLLKIYGLLNMFMHRTYSASFWSMDSHHLGEQESKASQYFDHAFIAHGEYLKLFEEEKTTHMPCAFSLASNTRVSQTLSAVRQESREAQNVKSLCAPFAAYPWQNRNKGYLKGLWAAQELDVNSFFGIARGGYPSNEGLMRLILSHHVVLNFSLKNDLNMRNFEALALNRVLLTNRVSDHVILSEFSQNIVFVNSDLSDLSDRIVKALETEPQDISAAFLKQHSLWPRVEEITKVLLNKSRGTFPSRPLRLSELDKPEFYGEQLDVTLKPHSATYLLSRSEWFSPLDLRKAVAEAEVPFVAVVKLLVLWMASAGQHIAASLVKRIPLLRALVRAFRASFR